MPFIGNQPALSYTSFAKQDFTTSATTSYTLNNPVANANELALFINFVRQEPTTAYTASGTSLTLTSATSASDDMYCVFLGKAVQTVNPPSGSVGTAQLADLAVTSGKLASGVLPDNTPSFQAYIGSSQGSISSNTYTKVQFDTEFFDTDNCYDNSTNYRFTPTTPGKYFCYASVSNSFSAGSPDDLRTRFYFNGSGASNLRETALIDYAGVGIALVLTQQIQAIITFNGSSDYLEVYARNDGTPLFTSDSYFGAYKLIGV